jgi:hypothetical protein
MQLPWVDRFVEAAYQPDHKKRIHTDDLNELKCRSTVFVNGGSRSGHELQTSHFYDSLGLNGARSIFPGIPLVIFPKFRESNRKA